MIILYGVVGSVAYGLDNENSDTDRLGVFIRLASAYWSLTKPEETIVHSKPDRCTHEIEKFLRLCLNCNPTVYELLWLEKYEMKDPLFGAALIGLRQEFLSTDRVSKAYGGYAMAQMKKLKTSNGARRIKHAKHCFRLLRQGTELLETGKLTLKVKNPKLYKVFERATPHQMEHLFNQEFEQFKNTKSVLPEKPNIDAINAYLYSIRLYNLEKIR